MFATGYDLRYQTLDERVAELVRAAASVPDLEVGLRKQIPGTNLKVLGFPIGAQRAIRSAPVRSASSNRPAGHRP